MKTRNMLWTSLMLLLTTGCGQNDTSDDPSDKGSTGAKNELRLVFGGTGESTEYTRGIASESENQIENLDIYVFAALNGSTDYQYLETWKMGDVDNTNGKTFVLQGAGTSRKASIFPTELKGAPSLKLYCVANSKMLRKADGNPVAVADLVPLTTDAATGAQGTRGTLSTLFESFYAEQTLITAGGALRTPLTMSGSVITKILGNVATVNIELKRRVARFDIDNDAAKTGLTIESISLGNGRPTATVSPLGLASIPEPDRKTKLIQYPTSPDFKLLPRANQGVTESALYTYPLDKTDKAYLIIKGKYQNPMQDQPVEVTYNLDITTQPDPLVAAAFIDVAANTRYTLRISEVMEATIQAFFEIVDWTSGGGVIVKPDNAAPEVKHIDVNNVPHTLFDKPIEIAAGVDQKTITIVATASGQVKPELSTGNKWPTDWLKYNDVAYSEVNPTGVQFEVKDGVPTTTMCFTCTVHDADVHSPVTLTLKNTSGAEDESVYTVLTVAPPAAAPALAFKTPALTTGNHNRYDVTVPAAPKLILYKARQSSLVLGVSCPFGTTIENKLSWLTVEKSAPTTTRVDVDVTTPIGEQYTFKLKDINATSDATSKVKIINAKNNKKFAELLVELKDPKITLIEVANVAPTTGVTISDDKIIGVPRIGERQFTATITSPEGVTASTLASWYTIAETTPFVPGGSGAPGTQTFTVTVKKEASDFTPAPIIFKNVIQGVDDRTVMVTAVAAAPIAAPTFVTGSGSAPTTGTSRLNSFDEGTKTLTLYKIDDSEYTFKMNCYYGMTVQATAGLSTEVITADAADAYGTITYKIKLTDKTIAGLGKITFINTKSAKDKTEITVVLKPSLKVGAVTGLNVVYDAATKVISGVTRTPSGTFTIEIETPQDITAALGGASNWFTVAKGAWANSKQTLTVTLKADPINDWTDGTIVLTDPLTTTETLTLTVKAAAAP